MKKDKILVVESDEISALTLPVNTNYVQKIGPIKLLNVCKGRHTYLNKGNGIWKCNCGQQLL